MMIDKNGLSSFQIHIIKIFFQEKDFKCFEIIQFIKKSFLYQEFIAKFHFITLKETKYMIHSISLQNRNSRVQLDLFHPFYPALELSLRKLSSPCKDPYSLVPIYSGPPLVSAISALDLLSGALEVETSCHMLEPLFSGIVGNDKTQLSSFQLSCLAIYISPFPTSFVLAQNIPKPLIIGFSFLEASLSLFYIPKNIGRLLLKF